MSNPLVMLTSHRLAVSKSVKPTLHEPSTIYTKSFTAVLQPTRMHSDIHICTYANTNTHARTQGVRQKITLTGTDTEFKMAVKVRLPRIKAAGVKHGNMELCRHGKSKAVKTTAYFV